VFYGFIALTMVTLWVITARYNPLIRGEFVYPFAFLNPWKILANVGGAAVVVGCLLMIRDRLRDSDQAGAGSYFDWLLISTVLLVAITGFITEILHYVRLEPHRHVAYFVHLVFVFAVLMYLPYSKLAHLAYRAVAIVFAEHIGRDREAAGSLSAESPSSEKEGRDHVAATSA
jgi:quinone-modifying oxidoreductase subunit QmoC